MSYISRYDYKGPVEEFGRCIAHEWTGHTYTTTLSRARSNLAHQFKQQYGKATTSKITLPGEIKVTSVGGDQNE